MPTEKLVPIDEELYNELVDLHADLEQDVIRATSIAEGGEFGSSDGVDLSLVEQALLTIDKVLTAYDYYSTPDYYTDLKPRLVSKPYSEKVKIIGPTERPHAQS